MRGTMQVTKMKTLKTAPAIAALMLIATPAHAESVFDTDTGNPLTLCMTNHAIAGDSNPLEPCKELVMPWCSEYMSKYHRDFSYCRTAILIFATRLLSNVGAH